MTGWSFVFDSHFYTNCVGLIPFRKKRKISSVLYFLLYKIYTNLNLQTSLCPLILTIGGATWGLKKFIATLDNDIFQTDRVNEQSAMGIS